MKIIPNLVQGSAQWHAHRARSHNASDAPAMLGESPYVSRPELLRRLATGIAPEVDPATQRRFDKGHAVEGLLRKVAEDMLGEPLHAFVGVADFDEKLSASFDGCTFVGDVTLECKLLNERLRAAFADMETIAPEHRERAAGQCLPIDYRIQMEQQLRVAEAERCLFMTGELRDDGTLGDTLSCWYYPDDALWKRIESGWAQFDADLAEYVPPAATPRVQAEPVESLPAVLVRMEGSLVVHSNLDAFGTALRAFIERIPAQPSTDQEFADTDAACKALKRAEEALEAEDARALNGMADVATVRRMMSDLRELARTTRLHREKLVKTRKDQLKAEQVQRGAMALAKHVQQLNERLGGAYMPRTEGNFAGCISGLKSLESIRGAIDTELAKWKIAANELADGIQVNLRTFEELAGEQAFLFADKAVLVLKQPADFRAIVAGRIAEHQAKVQREAEAAAERERERIRAEEQAKAEKAAREAAQAAAPAQPPAAAPIASPAASSQAPAVVPMPARGTKPTLRVGEIANRLGFGISEAFLRQLGFPPVRKEGASCLYYESDFPRMCDSLVAHIRTVQQQRAAA